MWKQLIQPNPNVPCKPGLCLKYVRDTYKVGAKYGTATAAWNASPTKHTGKDFPDAWVPVWFSLSNNPAGHVVLREPNGSVWSCSSPTSTKPVHHSSLAALEKYYGGRLGYRGWTEDINDVRVIEWKEDIEMISRNAAGLVVRFRLGRDIRQDEVDKWVGKKTFDQVDADIQNQPEFKEIAGKAKKANINLFNFVQGEIRNNYNK